MLKSLIVGTRIGRTVQASRDRWQLASARLEQTGTVANDLLALHLLTRLPKPNSTFIDVGAHIGSVTDAVLRRGSGLKVIAVEAMPDKADRLKAKFPQVEIHCCALADEQGETSFFVNPSQSGYSSLANNGQAVEIRVRMDKLDNIVRAKDVDVIKIDVEGAELGVIRGGEELIGRCRPTIMFESGPDEVLGYTKQAMFDWFSAHDYALFVPNRLAHTARPMTREVFLDSHHYPRRTTNYFAVANERINDVREAARF